LAAAHLYWGALALVALTRLGWWLAVAVVSARGFPLRKSIRRFRAHLRLGTEERMEMEKGKLKAAEWPEVVARHENSLVRFRTQRSDALTLGSLGLAAWGILTSTAVAGRLEPYSLDLLFVGVMLTIAGPVVFRSEGVEATRMGLATVVAVGYAAIVISLVSFLPAVFERRWLHAVGFAVALGLVARDVDETADEISVVRNLYRRDEASDLSERGSVERRNMIWGWALVGLMVALAVGTVVVALIYLAVD
jgi:hypothetical protein